MKYGPPPEYDPNFVEEKVLAMIGQKAVVVNKDGLVLLLQRSEKAGAGGKWALVGGGLEWNEDPLEGIKREIWEETQMMVEDANIQSLPARSYLTSENEFVVILGYSIRVESPTVILNWEHDDYQWLTPTAALKLDITESAKFLIEAFTAQNAAPH